VAAAWTGEAQVAYSALQKDWSTKTDDLHCVLFEIAKRMEEATQDYQGTDHKIANVFRGA
jgi:WXG100 family type VII secretion target